MKKEIRQIVYCSKATREIQPADMANILQGPRRRNEADEITGMLLFRSGQFLQVLEGHHDPLQALLDRVLQDPRHGLLSKGTCRNVARDRLIII